MKLGFFDKFPCEIMEGKALLIAIVIVFSSLSFTLGFFIGKKTQDGGFMENVYIPDMPETETQLVQAEAVNEIKTVEKKVIVPIVDEEEMVESSNNTEEKDEVEADNKDEVETNNEDDTNSQTTEGDITNKTHLKAAVAFKKTPKKVLVDEGVNTDVKKKAPEKSQNSTSNSTLDKIRQSIRNSKGEKYFVQAGAFKTLVSARERKKKLDGYGFKSSIYKQTLKDKTVWYKLRIGDFNTKQEASLALAKLNKKGISGFIRGYTR